MSPVPALIQQARRLAKQIAQLREREYDLILRMADAGYKDAAIARELGRGTSHVHRVRTGQRTLPPPPSR